MASVLVEERHCFGDDPFFRLAVSQSQQQLSQVQLVVQRITQATRKCVQLGAELAEMSQQIAGDLEGLENLLQASPWTGTGATTAGDPSRDIVAQLLRDFYTTADHHHPEHAGISDLGSTLFAKVREYLQQSAGTYRKQAHALDLRIAQPLMEFCRKLEFVNKTSREQQEKSTRDLESMLGKLMAVSKRKDPKKYSDAAQNVFIAKQTACHAALGHVHFLNAMHQRKDLFLLGQMAHFLTVMGVPLSEPETRFLISYVETQPTVAAKDSLFFTEIAIKSDYFRNELKQFQRSLLQQPITSPQCSTATTLEPLYPSMGKRGYLWTKSIQGGCSQQQRWMRCYVWIQHIPECTLMVIGETSVDRTPRALLNLCTAVCVDLDGAAVEDRQRVLELYDTRSDMQVLLQAETELEFQSWLFALHTLQHQLGAHMTMGWMSLSSSKTTPTSFDGGASPKRRANVRGGGRSGASPRLPSENKSPGSGGSGAEKGRTLHFSESLPAVPEKSPHMLPRQSHTAVLPATTTRLPSGHTNERIPSGSLDCLGFSRRISTASPTTSVSAILARTEKIGISSGSSSATASAHASHTATTSSRAIPEILYSGVLSIKTIKATRRPSQSAREYGNSIWRSARFRLYADGRLFQYKEEHGNGMKHATATAGVGERLEIVDLQRNVASRSFVQPVDESLFNRKYVLQILGLDGRLIYLAASGLHERQQWLFALKSAAKGFCGHIHVANGGLNFRVHRVLQLRIIEGRGFSTSGEPYCEVYFGSERKARTNNQPKNTVDPFWREDFQFEDLAFPRSGVTLFAMTQHKMHRDQELGRVLIEAGALKAGELEAWYPIVSTLGHQEGRLLGAVAGSLACGSNGSLSSACSGGHHHGDLKLRIKYEERVVLALENYEEMHRLFTQPNSTLGYDLAHVSPDLESIAHLLVQIYDAQQLAIPWIQSLMEREVQSTENMFVLFRGNSLLTKAMDCFMKACGMDYLEATLGETLREICNHRVHCEVDPTRLDKSEDLRTHWTRLIHYATTLWRLISQSRNRLPRELRILFHFLQRTVLRRYHAREDHYTSVRYTSVSGFLFLRLFCPAILNPKLFGLTRDFPEKRTARTLTLLAKTMQCLANLAAFGVKEPYMVEMNGFIMDHSNSMMEFIDSISKPVTDDDETPLVPRPIELDYQFSCLHRFVRLHQQDLENQVKTYRELGGGLSPGRTLPSPPQSPVEPPPESSKTIAVKAASVPAVVAKEATERREQLEALLCAVERIQRECMDHVEPIVF